MRASESNGPAVRNDVAGAVETSIQAGTVHGGVHVHHAPAQEPAVPLPRQLPARPAHFTARTRELAELDAVLVADAEAQLIVLSGAGGVGKTALALHWAHQARDRFRDGQLYVDLGGFGDGDPMDPREALGLFLRSLGVPAQRVPVDLAEQVSLYRSITAGLSLLVVLDNAFSAAQARVLIPPSATSVALVTSRRRLVGLVPDGARLIDLSPLDSPAGVELLARTVGRHRVVEEPELAEAVVRLCSGLPIAVCIAAARLAARPRWSLARVAEELADEHRRLASLSAHDDLSIQAIFDMSYRSLAPSTARFYRRLGMHPGPEFGIGVMSTLGDDYEDELHSLIEANLIEEISEDRFRFHDLLRLHARQRAHADERTGVRDDALRAMVEWYLAAGMAADLAITPYRRRLTYEFHHGPYRIDEFADRAEALAWFDRERVNFLHASRGPSRRGWPELAWHLADVMWPLLLHRKHYLDRLEIDERGVRAARRWGNAWAEADMLKRLGRVCTALGRCGDAERHLLDALELCHDIGDRRGAADVSECLALLRVDTGRVEEAAELFERLLATNRELGADRAVGLTLINLGAALSMLDRGEEAVGLLLEARDIFAAMSESDPYNGARAIVGLANAYRVLGRTGLARTAANEALAEMTRLDSHGGQAEAHEVLAEVANLDGDGETALRHIGLAVELFTRIGSPRARAAQDRLTQLDR